MNKKYNINYPKKKIEIKIYLLEVISDNLKMEIMNTYESKKIPRKNHCWFCNDDQLYTTGFCAQCFHDKYVIPRRQKNERLRRKWVTIIKKKYIANNYCLVNY